MKTSRESTLYEACQRMRICFVALDAYPLLIGGNPKSVVGPAVHSVLLAKEFVKHGFQVSLITYNYGKAPVERVNGIELIKAHRAYSYLNKVSKAFHIWKAMLRANANIYIHCGNLPVSLFCRMFRRKSIYEIASNALSLRELIDPENKEFHRPRFSIAEFFHQLDIILADNIIVQNEFQRRMLEQNYGKDSTLVKMPFPLSEKGELRKEKPPVILWVGAMADVKQPRLFLQLSQKIPEARFQMIGGYSLGNEALYEEIRCESQEISNLEFVGPVPFYEINEYFKRASILVNTSKFEGFPNAFLQAWMFCSPVVSLNADPDEIICRENLGFHSKNFDQLINDIRILMENEPLRKQIGMRARQYVEKNHDVAIVIETYANFLLSLIN
jgi:glycosyltransferase involved in cell wall biosynthesis